MYNYLESQYNAWTDLQQYLKDWHEQVQPCYRKFAARICQFENSLEIEEDCNAYAATAERHGFFAGYAWFLSLCRAAADYFPAGSLFYPASK